MAHREVGGVARRLHPEVYLIRTGVASGIPEKYPFVTCGMNRVRIRGINKRCIHSDPPAPTSTVVQPRNLTLTLTPPPQWSKVYWTLLLVYPFTHTTTTSISIGKHLLLIPLILTLFIPQFVNGFISGMPHATPVLARSTGASRRAKSPTSRRAKSHARMTMGARASRSSATAIIAANSAPCA